MDKETLLKIINNSWCKYSPIDEHNDEFKSMFEPEYKEIPFGEQNTKTCLKFNPKEHGLDYKSGTISCTGIIFKYAHERFDVSVHVFYSYATRDIYNSVLATPRYTVKDFNYRNSIRQSSVKVICDKDISNYFKRLRKRFECPII